jgi:hypothetical protein
MTCTLQKEYIQLARGVSVEGFRTAVTFRNLSQKGVVRVIFLFTMREAGGSELDSHTDQSFGAYAPSIEIDNIAWEHVDSWPTLAEMDCAVQTVLFQDGTSWSASASPGN